MADKVVEVKRQDSPLGRRSPRYGIYVNGKLVEGGFFYKQHAERFAEEYRQEVLRKIK